MNEQILRTTEMDIVLKLLKTSSGPLEIKVPRDRKAEFEPQIIKKHQTMLDELEHQIISSLL